jgi:F-box-like/WD domain, G-beta repeat
MEPYCSDPRLRFYSPQQVCETLRETALALIAPTRGWTVCDDTNALLAQGSALPKDERDGTSTPLSAESEETAEANNNTDDDQKSEETQQLQHVDYTHALMRKHGVVVTTSRAVNVRSEGEKGDSLHANSSRLSGLISASDAPSFTVKVECELPVSARQIYALVMTGVGDFYSSCVCHEVWDRLDADTTVLFTEYRTVPLPPQKACMLQHAKEIRPGVYVITSIPITHERLALDEGSALVMIRFTGFVIMDTSPADSPASRCKVVCFTDSFLRVMNENQAAHTSALLHRVLGPVTLQVGVFLSDLAAYALETFDPGDLFIREARLVQKEFRLALTQPIGPGTPWREVDVQDAVNMKGVVTARGATNESAVLIRYHAQLEVSMESCMIGITRSLSHFVGLVSIETLTLQNDSIDGRTEINYVVINDPEIGLLDMVLLRIYKTDFRGNLVSTMTSVSHPKFPIQPDRKRFMVPVTGTYAIDAHDGKHCIIESCIAEHYGQLQVQMGMTGVSAIHLLARRTCHPFEKALQEIIQAHAQAAEVSLKRAADSDAEEGSASKRRREEGNRRVDVLRDIGEEVLFVDNTDLMSGPLSLAEEGSSGDLSVKQDFVIGFPDHDDQPPVLFHSFVEAMPDSILVHIFGFLSPRDIGMVSRVCRHLRRVSLHSDAWETVFAKMRTLGEVLPDSSESWRNLVIQLYQRRAHVRELRHAHPWELLADASVSDVSISPDGQLCAVVSANGVQTWDIPRSSSSAFLPSKSYAVASHTAVNVGLPSVDFVWTGFSSGLAAGFHPNSNDLLTTRQLTSPDPSHFLFLSQQRFVRWMHSRVEVFGTSGDQTIRNLLIVAAAPMVSCVCASPRQLQPASSMLVTGSTSGVVACFEVPDVDEPTQPVQTIRPSFSWNNGAEVLCVAVHAPTMTCAAGSIDGVCSVWYLGHREPARVQQLVGHEGAIQAVLLSEDYIFTGGSDGTVRLWARTCQGGDGDSPSGIILARVEAEIQSMAFYGNHLLVGTSKKAFGLSVGGTLVEDVQS